MDFVGIEAGEDERVEAHEDERVEAHEDEHGLYYQILPMKFGCGGCRTHLANQLDLVGVIICIYLSDYDFSYIIR